jgi:hypothetical protein
VEELIAHPEGLTNRRLVINRDWPAEMAELSLWCHPAQL